MPKSFVTFGQNHTHSINGKTIDKDCVAVIEANTAQEGRELAFELFDRKFSMEYFDKEWDETMIDYYPRGYVYLYGGEDHGTKS